MIASDRLSDERYKLGYLQLKAHQINSKFRVLNVKATATGFKFLHKDVIDIFFELILPHASVMTSNSAETTEDTSFERWHCLIFFRCLVIFCVVSGLAGFLLVGARGWPRIRFDSLVGGRGHAAHMTPLSQPQLRYSTGGRRIQTPNRLRDFCLV